MGLYTVDDLEAVTDDLDVLAHALWRGVQRKAQADGIDKPMFGMVQSQETAGAVLKWLIGLSDYDRKQVVDWLLTRGAK